MKDRIKTIPKKVIQNGMENLMVDGFVNLAHADEIMRKKNGIFLMVETGSGLVFDLAPELSRTIYQRDTELLANFRGQAVDGKNAFSTPFCGSTRRP